MADEEQNRSEAPTAHKLQRARGKGQVARGMDLSFLASLIALLLYAWMAGAGLMAALSQAMHDAFVGSAQLSGGSDVMFAAIALLGGSIERPLALFALSAFAVVLLFEVLQTGLIFSSEPLKIDFARLNPARGLKRLFTIRLLIETAKSILKLGGYSAAAWLLIRTMLHSDIASVSDAASLAGVISHTATRFVATFAGLAFAFAVLDQLVSRRDFLKRMRMSRREIKQEHRDREGEPRLKQKRKQMHAEFVRGSRSVRGLRGADMLVVNPQHIAIGLRYDPRTMAAPAAVSIGVNHLALRLKRLAFIYGIPVIEDRLLAKALLRGASINGPIPSTSFQAVANLYNRLRRQGALKIR